MAVRATPSGVGWRTGVATGGGSGVAVGVGVVIVSSAVCGSVVGSLASDVSEGGASGFGTITIAGAVVQPVNQLEEEIAIVIDSAAVDDGVGVKAFVTVGKGVLVGTPVSVGEDGAGTFGVTAKETS